MEGANIVECEQIVNHFQSLPVSSRKALNRKLLILMCVTFAHISTVFPKWVPSIFKLHPLITGIYTAVRPPIVALLPECGSWFLHQHWTEWILPGWQHQYAETSPGTILPTTRRCPGTQTMDIIWIMCYQSFLKISFVAKTKWFATNLSFSHQSFIWYGILELGHLKLIVCFASMRSYNFWL